MQKIKIPLLENMHGHLRQDRQLDLFVPFAARFCHHYVAMGNTKPPILTAQHATGYHFEIFSRAPKPNQSRFKPLVAIKVTEDTTVEMILEALQKGYRLFKFYPRAKTTHADDGIGNYFRPNLVEIYHLIAEYGGYALFHPEHPDAYWDDMDCELMFFGIFEAIYNLAPSLNMVWEHLTDTRVLEPLLGMEERVACTVTAHHMMIRLNDVLGQNHLLCRPPAKRGEDKKTLREFVTQGKSRRIMLGLDDAPHDRAHKECKKASCGVWTMPVAPHIIVQIFDEENALFSPGIIALQRFVALNARDYYKLPEQDGSACIKLARKPYRVPFAYRLGAESASIIPVGTELGVLPTDFVPFMAGEELPWSVVD